MSDNTQHSIELISFKICPFVQRSVIALKEKGVDFDVTYIDLSDPPAWFSEVSPLGKVPVLKVDDTVLFESAVISEFLDEVYPPQLHPASPLEKAHHRAWVEFGSDLIGRQFQMMMADNADDFAPRRDALEEGLSRLQGAMTGAGPFFGGAELALIDTAMAPIFMRLAIINQHRDLGVFSADSALGRWSDALLARDSVQSSVVPEFEALFVNFFRAKNSYALS